jgi:hypothetical protein
MQPEGSASKKPCLVCFEPIDARARKCHHCREIQSPASAWMHHPAVLTTFMILLGLLIVWVGYTAVRGLRKPPFSGQLAVGAAQLRLANQEGEPRVSCVAPITNNDTIPWGSVSLQAEFLDAQGQVIDVHHNQYTFRILPGLQATGRASGPANAASSEYAACRVTILSAHAGF